MSEDSETDDIMNHPQTLSMMLSRMSIDSLATIVAKAVLHDQHLPTNAACLLMDLVATLAVMGSDNDRLAIVRKMRNVSEILERQLLDQGEKRH